MGGLGDEASLPAGEIPAGAGVTTQLEALPGWQVLSTCCDLRNALNRIKLALPGWQSARKASANFGRMEVGCRLCWGRLCQSLLRLAPPVVTAKQHCYCRHRNRAASLPVRSSGYCQPALLLPAAVAGGGRRRYQERYGGARLVAAAGGGWCWRRAFTPTRREG